MTEQILNRLGARPSGCGYRYLSCAMDLTQADPALLFAVTGRLYPSIARHFGVSPSSVERAIRYCLARCWEAGDHACFDEIAGFPLKHRPRTKEFIAMLLHYMGVRKTS